MELKISEKVRNIIFVTEGGLGRNIAATAVVRALKKAYPDKRIIVMAGYQDIFLYNPNVYKVFNFNNPLYFYEDFVNEESIVIKSEPYLDYGYITKQSHIVTSWCKEIGIPSDGIQPDLFFLPNEVKSAEIYASKLTDNFKKDLILLQWIGGKTPNDKSEQELQSSIASMFRRHIKQEVTQELVNKLIAKGNVVGVVGHDNFPEIKNATKIQFPIRSVLALLLFAKTFIGIDSFLQHGAAAKQINKKGLVCWRGTSPTCLGYDSHINLTKEVCPKPFCHRPNTYLFDVQPHGALWDCPYGEPCLAFTADEIMKGFNQLSVKKEKKDKK